MNDNVKSENYYRTIGQVAKELDLVDKKTGSLQTHTLRYWETQFKQIKPSIKAGKRRYYSKKDLKIIKFVKFLLKEKGLTINGVKKILNNIKSKTLDENIDIGLYSDNFEKTKAIKERVKKISEIIREIKKIK